MLLLSWLASDLAALGSDGQRTRGNITGEYPEKLQSIDAAKFDALPDDAFFKKYFIRQVPHTRCTGCYAAKFGTAANVRAKEVANKVYFYNSNYVVYKLLARFGIEVERVMIRAS